MISGPMKGLKNPHGEWTTETHIDMQTDTQTNRHVDSMTDPAQRAESVKIIYDLY